MKDTKEHSPAKVSFRLTAAEYEVLKRRSTDLGYNSFGKYIRATLMKDAQPDLGAKYVREKKRPRMSLQSDISREIIGVIEKYNNIYNAAVRLEAEFENEYARVRFAKKVEQLYSVTIKLYKKYQKYNAENPGDTSHGQNVEK